MLPAASQAVSEFAASSGEPAAPRAAYVHVPFCAHRCGYCNFTLIAGRDDLIAGYLRGVERELAQMGKPHEVDTLFFGGGTPTHLPPADLARLLEIVLCWFPLAAGHEASVEANPIDVDDERLTLLAAYGINRLSLGGQSFDAAKLARLERDHTPEILRQAVLRAKRHIANVSLDLIFAAPRETLAGWQADLTAAVALAPEHISTYGLTFERGAHFWSRLARGDFQRLDEELERSMYATAIDRLTAAGYEHYEVSNFARAGRRCRHNETYWAGRGYFAVGPGASRYVDGRRETNHRSTTTWLKRVLSGASPVAESEKLVPEDRARESLVFGLRRLAGVERAEFARQTGFAIDDLVRQPLAEFARLGLLADDGSTICLTRKGLFVSDAIWPRFLRA